MKTILVTGGSGFLGSEVCRMLVEAGHRVVDISVKTNHVSGVEGHVVDITDYPAIDSIIKNDRFDAIIHLAALLTTQSNQNPVSAFRVNVLGAHHLLEAARNHQIPRFVYSSSFSIIGPIPMKQCPVDEEVIQVPINFYGETKRFVEKMCISYAQKFGLQVAIGRLGALVGPGEPLGTSAWRMDIFNMLKTGGSITYKFTSRTRLLISHLKDTARAFLCLALAEKPQHAIYHLTHDALTMQQLSDIMHELNPDIHFVYGTTEQVDMPHSVSTRRFEEEFDFKSISIHEALKSFKNGSY
jgi:nucleoside-diphosphate-sugar epimerase